jgi:hypothetical protein
MSRESYKAIERSKKIGSMSMADQRAYLESEKRHEPEEDSADSRAAVGSAPLDFIQTLNALEAYPGGKNFIAACRVLAGEVAREQKWEVSEYALRVARATLVTREDRKNAN